MGLTLGMGNVVVYMRIITVMGLTLGGGVLRLWLILVEVGVNVSPVITTAVECSLLMVSMESAKMIIGGIFRWFQVRMLGIGIVDLPTLTGAPLIIEARGGWGVPSKLTLILVVLMVDLGNLVGVVARLVLVKVSVMMSSGDVGGVLMVV